MYYNYNLMTPDDVMRFSCNQPVKRILRRPSNLRQTSWKYQNVLLEKVVQICHHPPGCSYYFIFLAYLLKSNQHIDDNSCFVIRPVFHALDSRV